MSMSNPYLLSHSLISRMLICVKDYELIKLKQHPFFKTVKAFCEHNKFSHQNFMRFYNRYKISGDICLLAPQKRGPKYKTRRTDLDTEQRIIKFRLQGNNRHAIKDMLKGQNISKIPCETTIYNICKKHGLNRLKKEQSQERSKEIRKMSAAYKGELAHIDCHTLSKGITIAESHKTYYLLGVIDAYTRACWVEVIEDKTALSVMFATLKAFNMLRMNYGIEFESALTDNGAEFGSGKASKNKQTHPFERLLLEMDIKHRYTRPYRPQTNGKIERFWKTLNEDFIEGSLYESLSDLKDELLGYMAYYNHHRKHSSLNYQTPEEMSQSNTKTCN